MTPLWLLLTPQELATVTAGVLFGGSLVVAVFAAEFATHRSTVDGSSPEGTPAPSGGGPWIVAATEREPACAASTPAPPPVVAAETEQVSARTCPTPVGVGDPTQS